MVKHFLVAFALLIINSTVYAQRVEGTHFSVTTIDITTISTERTIFSDEITTSNGFYFTEGFGSTDIPLSFFDGQNIHPVMEGGDGSLRLLHAWEDGILLRRKTNTTSYFFVDDATLTLTQLLDITQGENFRQTVINDRVIIVGKDDKLYSTDGTVAGTSMILDDFDESNTRDGIGSIVDGFLYFSTNDKVYRTDGTRAGTSLLWEGSIYEQFGFKKAGNRIVFRTGSALMGCSLTGECEILVEPANRFSSPQLGFNDFGNFALFTLRDSDSGKEIWKTDGTAAGTELVVDLRPGSGSGVQTAFADDHFAHAENLYFKGYDQNAQSALQTRVWQSDGTATGTMQATDFTELTGINQFWEIQEHIGTKNNSARYFSTNVSFLGGHEVWGIGSGPEATVQLLGRTRKLPENKTDYYRGDDYVAFHTSNLNNGDRFKYLYVLNGPDVPMLKVDSFVSVANILGPAGDKFVIAANKSGELGGPNNIYLIDKNSPGSTLVPGTTSHGSHFNLNGELFFTNQDSIHGTSFWKTDGTVAGTVFVADVNPGTDDSEFHELYQGGNHLYMGTGGKLWSSGGTNDTTQIVYDPSDLTRLLAATSEYSVLRNFASEELIISDGTPAGTFIHNQTDETSTDIQVSQPIAFDEAFFYTTIFQAPFGGVNMALIRIDPVARTVDTLTKTSSSNGTTHSPKIHASKDLIYCHLFKEDNPAQPSSQYLVLSDGTPAGTRVNLDVPLLPGNEQNILFYPVDDFGVIVKTQREGRPRQLELTENGTDFTYIKDFDFNRPIEKITRIGNRLILLERNEIVSISGHLEGNPVSTPLFDDFYVWDLIRLDSTKALFTTQNSTGSSVNLYQTDGTIDNTIEVTRRAPFFFFTSSAILGNHLFFIESQTIYEINLVSGEILDYEFVGPQPSEILPFGSTKEQNGRVYFFGEHPTLGNELNYLEFAPGVITSVEPGLNQQNSKKGPKIFPNPSPGNFTIFFEERDPVRIDVYDLTGRQLFTILSNKQADIELSGYPVGIYLFKITNILKQETSLHKVIRQ